ncbi:Jacalin-like lectin domain-containing protein [Astrocystis sublimbata]|nr:Jacalin-like lectin domain-containing protein [Astrocystis sublimbata]
MNDGSGDQSVQDDEPIKMVGGSGDQSVQDDEPIKMVGGSGDQSSQDDETIKTVGSSGDQFVQDDEPIKMVGGSGDQSVQDNEPIKIVGGSGDQFFQDDERESNLRQIHIRCDHRVDSLQCIYDDGSSSDKHGGDGGKDEIFALGPDEAIITVWIWSGTEIHAIQFRTTTGRLSSKYGGDGGTLYTFHGNNGTRERALRGFAGRSGAMLTALVPLWSNTRELEGEHLVVGPFQGGDGGDQFDMLTTVGNALPFTLKAIYIRSGIYVDAIECVLADVDGRGVRTGLRGGDGGETHVFTLEKNERIIRVEGRANKIIDRLQFFTDKGRASPTYGGDGGHAFVWNPPHSGNNSPADTNMSLMCFQGRSGKCLERLAPVWAPDPPVHFALTIDWFDAFIPTMNGKPFKSDQLVENREIDKTSSKMVWTMPMYKSSTITLSDSSRKKLGGKVVFDVISKGKPGIPFIFAESADSMETGIESSAEDGWGNTATDGQTVSRTYNEIIVEQNVTLQTRKQLYKSAKAWTISVEGLEWIGHVIVTYLGGGKKTIAVDGTFDGDNAGAFRTTYSIGP